MAPKYRLEFEIEDLPQTINSIGRKHWTVKAREARKWRDLVRLKSRAGCPVAPLDRARISLTRFSTRAPDSDGLVSSFKHVIDGLISSGVLVNDSFNNIGMPEYKWEKAPKGKGKIKVVVESVEEENSQSQPPNNPK